MTAPTEHANIDAVDALGRYFHSYSVDLFVQLVPSLSEPLPAG